MANPKSNSENAKNQSEIFPKTITLTNRDFDRMMEVIENPPKPNRALKKLMADRRKRIANGDHC